MRIMSLFVFVLIVTKTSAANITGEQLKLALVTLFTFLILSIAATWLFKKWVKMDRSDDKSSEKATDH